LNGAPNIFLMTSLLHQQRRLGAPFKPYFGLSGIPQNQHLEPPDPREKPRLIDW
jgi:hypothetical protein